MESILFSRTSRIADAVSDGLRECSISVAAALYRMNSARLAAELGQAMRRGVRVRLLVDQGKYNQDAETRRLLSQHRLPFRLLHGRRGEGSKLHHKFAVLDGRFVLTGSYNWTTESEEENYENLVVLNEPEAASRYGEEFEALWLLGKDEVS